MKFVQLQRPLDWNYQTATVGPVADSVALSALTGYVHRDVCLVENIGLFRFEAYSIQAEAVGDIIAPDDIIPPAPGRWVRFSANADSDLTAFANVVGQTIYVDGTNGDDLNPGTEVLPVKTIQNAIGKAAVYNTTNPTKTCLIEITSGSYAETLSFANTALTQVHLKARAGFGDEGVLVTGMNTTVDTENLKHLVFDGISFSQATTLACDINGVSNYFGYNGIFFDHCEFDGTATFTNLFGLTFRNSYIDSMVCSNVISCTFQSGAVLQGGQSTFPYTFDTTQPRPQTNTTSYLSFSGGSSCTPAPIISRGAGTGIVQLSLAGGNINCSAAAVQLGAGCRIVATGGAIQSSLYGTTSASSSIYLRGGAINNIHLWTFDPATTFSISDSRYLSDPSTIYVNQATGNDVFNGSYLLPVKTLARAVALAALIDQTSTRVTIKIADGTYAEDLVLENIALKNLSIIANTVSGVTVNALSSTTLNQNLAYLYIEGIKFLNASTLSCDVTGAGNLLCSARMTVNGYDSSFTNCYFSLGLTISAACFIKLSGTYVWGAKCIITNSYVSTTRSDVTSTSLVYGADVIWDQNSPIPNGLTNTTLSLFYSSLNTTYNSVTVKTLNTSSIKSFIYNGTSANIGAIGVIAVGPYGQITNYTTAEMTCGAGSTVDSTSKLRILGGVLNGASGKLGSDLTLDPAATIDYGNLSGFTRTYFQNTDIDIGTEDIDAFPDKLGSAAIWNVTVKQGSAFRVDRVTVCWDAANDVLSTVAIDTITSIGDTSNLTLNVVLTSNTIKLQATAAVTNNWIVYANRTLIP